MNRRGFGRAAARAAAGAGAAAAGLGAWPGGAGVPAARAYDEWCDTDPLLVIRTPAGNLVPVYYLTGVYGERHVVEGLLGNLSAAYTAEAAAGGTRVTVRVTVPNGPDGATYPTRLTVSSGPWGTLTVYGRTTGTSGAPMAVEFLLGVP
jgi:hypothetical protein